MNERTAKKENVGDALVLIPDIGGFTISNRNIDIVTGKYIVAELLLSIINSNHLNLKVSGIEKDVVFLYRFGKAPDFLSIINQHENMLINFRKSLRRINYRYRSDIDLSLKLIAHYGKVRECNINGLKKISGKIAKEAHLLMENPIECLNYALLTGQLLQESNFQNDKHMPNWIKQKEKIIEIENLALPITYFEFDIENDNFNRLF